MAEFLLGFLIAGVVGITLTYNCYNKRETTEKRLKQNVSNLEHNLTVMKRESELKIDQLETEVKKLRDENRRLTAKIEIVTKDLSGAREQLEECKQRLAE